MRSNLIELHYCLGVAVYLANEITNSFGYDSMGLLTRDYRLCEFHHVYGELRLRAFRTSPNGYVLYRSLLCSNSRRRT